VAEKCTFEEGPVERAADRHEEPPCADPQLLERFVKQGDQAAFALLLKRHGPMVWTVCRRLLQHVEDAEDAFQATFLVLARNAARIQKRELLANWLYGVAYKVAAHSRTKIARRQSREAPDLVVETVPAAEDKPSDVQAVLQEEVHSLPAKYRAPIVLCYLQGKSNEEAAADLRCPVGTVKGRLARAREKCSASARSAAAWRCRWQPWSLSWWHTLRGSCPQPFRKQPRRPSRASPGGNLSVKAT
jgi:RNA polymerase sigma factor (sigma-70 family)